MPALLPLGPDACACGNITWGLVSFRSVLDVCVCVCVCVCCMQGFTEDLAARILQWRFNVQKLWILPGQELPAASQPAALRSALRQLAELRTSDVSQKTHRNTHTHTHTHEQTYITSLRSPGLFRAHKHTLEWHSSQSSLCTAHNRCASTGAPEQQQAGSSLLCVSTCFVCAVVVLLCGFVARRTPSCVLRIGIGLPTCSAACYPPCTPYRT